MQTPNARVRRDDEVKIVAGDASSSSGDVLELEAGDAVAADARLLQTHNLAAEESALTGESVPVAEGRDAPRSPTTRRSATASTMVFVGTSIVRGKGRAVVIATGARTELGKLVDAHPPAGDQHDAARGEARRASASRSSGRASRSRRCSSLRGHRPAAAARWHELLLEAVSLAVAAIPEGLPAITTITLALGMQRMAKRGAIVRKLAAVETLGAATVICSDKTGTLTQNEMTVREVYAGGDALQGHRRRATTRRGDFLDADEQRGRSPDGPRRSAICSRPSRSATTRSSRRRDGGWQVVGDPTEGALLTLAAKGGVPARVDRELAAQVVKELPFDSDRKRMTIVALDEHGRARSCTSRAAPTSCCRSASTLRDATTGRAPLDDEARARILAEAERMSGQALRVLAVRAARSRRALRLEPPAEHAEHDRARRAPTTRGRELTFLGLVGMIDPPREGVKEAVATCAEAHVRAVMITGDHKLTAVAIAQELGLWDEGAMALTGARAREARRRRSSTRASTTVRVFARVTAEQKLRIVRGASRRAGTSSR